MESAGAPPVQLRRGSSTIGAAGDWRRSLAAGSSCTWGSSQAGSATSRAKGRAGRRLRRRSRATAARLLASTSSWKPPTPCSARIPPAASNAAASAISRALRAAIDSPGSLAPAAAAGGDTIGFESGSGFGFGPNFVCDSKFGFACNSGGDFSSGQGTRAPGPAGSTPVTRESRGPQAGQLIVSAWKRRSAGSANSMAQTGQGTKAVRVVWARHQDSAVAIV